MKDSSPTNLYKDWSGTEPVSVRPFDGEGSSRRYYRVSGPSGNAILCIGTDLKENESFFTIGSFFKSKGLPVPEIYAVSRDRMSYLQQDLGTTTLYDLISKSDKSLDTTLGHTMELLPEFQLSGLHGFDFSKCYPRAEFDRRSVMWDLNYFKYCFAKPAGINIDEDRLEDEFDSMSAHLSAAPADGLMLRDFQSRNVMAVGTQPYFIDFQGARKGPALYDLASFLWQTRAGFSDKTRESLADKYHRAWIKCSGRSIEDFDRNLKRFALLRTIQVLGTYGFRGLIQHKSKFITEIPDAVENMVSLSEEFKSSWPYIHECALALAGTRLAKPIAGDGRLKVSVHSFSYKKGIPDDLTGRGGGFVFDCRGLHNPGRYECYRNLTGLDRPVIEFLDSQTDMQTFLNNSISSVDMTVENYIPRGIDNLSVSFGCTGGRHRSVYAAEHLSRHLIDKYDITVELTHREQGITHTCNGGQSAAPELKK